MPCQPAAPRYSFTWPAEPGQNVGTTLRLFPPGPRSTHQRLPPSDTVASPRWLHKMRSMATLPSPQRYRSPNIYISSRAAVIALSSTDQPVRGGLTAIRYRRSRAAPAAVSPGAIMGRGRPATGSAYGTVKIIYAVAAAGRVAGDSA
jgi:hypothetical protein